MAEPSTFRGTLDFLDNIGIFDVVLPFLLVFTIVFALLEKTRILGTEKMEDGKEYSKKHLNSLASFVIAFFVIASARLVDIVTSISANLVILLLTAVAFLLLAGSFHQQKPEGYFLEGPFRTLFMMLAFAGMVIIFLNAITTGKGETWLSVVFGWIKSFSDNVSVAAVILVIIVVAIMYFIGAIGPHKSAEAKGNEKK
ncbi:hypothetical protein HYX10_01195 [Candidatus Woesearchaeota archaeon]|nr:hypothetical protein [Candidatus Woesearchaeota archaeon]